MAGNSGLDVLLLTVGPKGIGVKARIRVEKDVFDRQIGGLQDLDELLKNPLEVIAFLAARPGRIHLERLPAYSPELNPTELVWNQLKQRLKYQVFVSLAELTAAVLKQISQFEKDSKLIRVFFQKK